MWIQRAQVGRITDQMFTFNHYQKYFKACFIYDCSLRFFSLWFCPLDYGSLFIFDFSIFPQALGFRIFYFFLIRISYLECMFNFRAPPLACFITILDHIDIFQKLSIHLPVTRLATSVVLKIEQTLLTQIPTFFSLKSPPVMSKCASIVFYLSILTLEHKLFRS